MKIWWEMTTQLKTLKVAANQGAQDDHPYICDNPIVENNVFFRAFAMTVVRAPDRGVLILGLIAAVSAFIVSSSLVSDL